MTSEPTSNIEPCAYPQYCGREWCDCPPHTQHLAEIVDEAISMSDLVEKCLRIMHGHTSWSVIKSQWPEAAVSERRRLMEEVIREVLAVDDKHRELRRLSGCLLAISGAEGCGNGALRTAAYEAATMGATPGILASKLGLPSPLKGSAETHG